MDVFDQSIKKNHVTIETETVVFLLQIIRIQGSVYPDKLLFIRSIVLWMHSTESAFNFAKIWCE